MAVKYACGRYVFLKLNETKKIKRRYLVIGNLDE
jgi:hypothetical protein